MASKKQQTRRLTAALTREDDEFVAQCLEVDVASQGKTVEAALKNLTEALELYFEDSDEVPSAAPIIAPVDVKLRRAS
jgi:predicted RNase H-like HicB family nuclease